MSSPLAEYLAGVMEERRLSQRALAMYVGVSSATINRILKVGEADPDTLVKIADYLNVPVDNLFRLAGWLDEEQAKSRAIRAIEHLMRQLPEDKQREILEMVKTMHRLYTGQQTEQTEEAEAETSEG